MTRKEVREHLFQMLFVVDFHKTEDLEQQVSVYLDGMKDSFEGTDREQYQQKICGELREKFFQVVAHREEIDKKIEEKAKGWSLKRMAKADVTVLRLAIYEILFDEDVPAGVAVNEAVEIAKKFGTDASPSFVNGILGTIVRENEKE